jgi:hypothetical protein
VRASALGRLPTPSAEITPRTNGVENVEAAHLPRHVRVRGAMDVFVHQTTHM